MVRARKNKLTNGEGGSVRKRIVGPTHRIKINGPLNDYDTL